MITDLVCFENYDYDKSTPYYDRVCGNCANFDKAHGVDLPQGMWPDGWSMARERPKNRDKTRVCPCALGLMPYYNSSSITFVAYWNNCYVPEFFKPSEEYLREREDMRAEEEALEREREKALADLAEFHNESARAASRARPRPFMDY